LEQRGKTGHCDAILTLTEGRGNSWALVSGKKTAKKKEKAIQAESRGRREGKVTILFFVLAAKFVKDR